MIKMKDIKKIVSVIGIILLLFIIVWCFTLSTIANSQCKQLCDNVGTPFREVIHSGNWVVDDLCLCIWENATIKSFKLGNG